MAKNPNQPNQKTNVSKPPVVQIEGDETEVAEAPEQSAPTEVKVAAAPLVKQPLNVSAKRSSDDMVPVTVFEQIDPPPVVGSYSVGRELGITKMVPKQTYKLPRFVAEVIIDAKKGVIIE